MSGQLDRAGQEIAAQWNPLFTGQAGLVGVNPKGIVPVRSNIVDLGGVVTDTSLGTTDIGYFAAIRANKGDVITRVKALIGATAAVTPTHSAVAIYGGANTGAGAKLIAKSADGLTAAIAASKPYAVNLEEPVELSEETAPHGFVYALFTVTAGTVPSVATLAVGSGVHYAWFANSPVFLGGSAGSALKGVPPSTLTGAAATGNVPVLVLE